MSLRSSSGVAWYTPDASEMVLVIMSDRLMVLLCVQCLGFAYSTSVIQDLCMKLPDFLVNKVRVKLDLMQNAVKVW